MAYRRRKGSPLQLLRANHSWMMLSPVQTIATCQCNISQNRWAQHVVCIWPPCCDVLRHVRALLAQALKWSNLSQQLPICRNRVAICCKMLCWHVAIVWPGALGFTLPLFRITGALFRYFEFSTPVANRHLCASVSFHDKRTPLLA